MGFLSAVTIHMSLEVTLATSCILTQRTLEGLHTCRGKNVYIYLYIFTYVYEYVCVNLKEYIYPYLNTLIDMYI